ncbi:MAG: FAD-binding protein [Geminicoccaceae bacterium]
MRARVSQPRDAKTLIARWRETVTGAGKLVQGATRSYGDCHLSGFGKVVSTVNLDAILAIDPVSQIAIVESGVTFRQLHEHSMAHDLMAPVSPGTAFVTMGGAVANDVHGKNHVKDGSFGRHLVWLDLLLPSGEVRRLSPNRDGRLFWASVGGIGLTGVVLRLALKLQRVSGRAVIVRQTRVAGLEQMLALLRSADDPYAVGWVDALAEGDAIGRGLFETAREVDQPFDDRSSRPVAVPFDMPGWLLSGHSVRAFNHLYRNRVPAEGCERLTSIRRFLYPLDALHQWNRIYGSRGFRQFQCVIPWSDASAAIARLLAEIALAGNASFLAVIKALGQAGSGWLSFPKPGVTLALDIPWRQTTDLLFRRLEAITLEHGGRIYLAKDACLSAEGFRRMYPNARAFARLLDDIDPYRMIRSEMASRLRIRDLT